MVACADTGAQGIAEVGEGRRVEIQGQTWNNTRHNGGGARENGGDRDNGNGGKWEETNDRGPAGEKERQRSRGVVPRGW